MTNLRSLPSATGRRARALAAVIALVAVGPVVSADAAADVAPATTAPVMVVLDASGSMTTADAPGPRIDAAKKAVTGLVRGLPASARVGLLVYGTGTGSGAADRAAGCRDLHVLVPVSRLDKARLVRAVTRVRARGYTPIGASLTRAAAALPAGPGSIVLVSDGEDTCAPPQPCAVAAGLVRVHRDLVIHTIGFRVDAPARRQLRCIARAGGGTYRDAADGPGLGVVLQTQVDAGLRPYTVSGTPIDGTPTPEGAPPITVGQYADTFPGGAATTKHYSIELAARETVHVATTVVPPALRGGGTGDRLEVVVRLSDPSGHRCLPTEREHDSVLAGKVDPVTTVLSGVVGGPSWSGRCPTDGRFVVAVTRDSASTTVTASETVVRFEAPVSPVPPAAVQVPPGLPAPHASGPRTSCTGGASFDTAPLLTTGGCRDTLATGETRYYRVHLGWGQRLAYRIVVGRVTGAGHGVGQVQSAVSTPLRERVTLASTSNAARDFGGPVSTAVSGSTLIAVGYGNRDSTRSDIRPYSLAGDYFLSLGMSYPVAKLPYRTDVAVDVRVVGTVRPGPHYLALPSAASPSTTPPSTTSPSAAASPASSAPSGVVASDGDAAGTSTAWLGWVGGLAGVVAVAGVLLIRRRRSAHER